MLISTAGHVDHGKTELVKALTGVHTDRLPEEKARGISIDLGFAYCPLPNGLVLAFIDVPGHEKFLRNMLAGARGIDFALLVIAADDGLKPQTHEHLAILDLLGVREGAVAITKSDLVEARRLENIIDEARHLLRDTSLIDAPIFPVSAPTGMGIDTLKGHLIETAGALPSRPVNGPFRLAVDRSFTIAGEGVIVTGTAISGQVAVGDWLRLLPNGREVRVRGIRSNQREAQIGRAGERCALKIARVDQNELRRGDVLAALGEPVSTSRLDARLRLLHTEERDLTHWTPVHVHLGATFVPGRISLIEPLRITPGESGLGQIVLERATWAACGDQFILRDQSATRTLGGGTIIDPLAHQRNRSKSWRIERLRILESPEHDVALDRMLNAAPAGVNLDEFALGRNLSADEADRLFNATDLVLIRKTPYRIAISRHRCKRIREALLLGLSKWHEAKSDLVGPNPAQLIQSLSLPDDRQLIAHIVDVMVRERSVIREGRLLRLPQHSPRLTHADAMLWNRIRSHIAPSTRTPPTLSELAARLKMQKPPLENFLRRAAQRGQLLRVAPNRFFHPQAIRELAVIAETLSHEANDNEFNVATYRDASTIGRNLAIEVLEYFDRAGFTRRHNDMRRIICSVTDVFGDPEV